jgi:ribose 5-phosphate isomerase A
MPLMSADDMKREAAQAALAHVQPGMHLGLGHGSTVKHFVDLLGEQVREGLEVLCVAASEATQAQAIALGIRTASLDELPQLDLYVDGADEIGPELALIKGGGGALLREKIVATAARRFVVIADESKLVPCLGRFPLPVEVVPFGLEATRLAMLRLAVEAGLPQELVLRRGPDGHVFVTDGGHHIIDCHFQRIEHPAALAAGLVAIPGVVEHGLFLGLAQAAWVAGPEATRLITPA